MDQKGTSLKIPNSPKGQPISFTITIREEHGSNSRTSPGTVIINTHSNTALYSQRDLS